jgi:hypothetical protein
MLKVGFSVLKFSFTDETHMVALRKDKEMGSLRATFRTQTSVLPRQSHLCGGSYASCNAGFSVPKLAEMRRT